VRAVQLPTCAAFEVVAAYVHRAGFNAVVVVVYRPGSDNATQSLIDEFDSLLERLSTYSALVVIVGDFNIHVDDTTDTGASKLRELLSTYGLLQHVWSATHRHSHTLDLLITRDDQVVNVLPIDPPLLSDHSFVVATVGCVPFASQSTSACQMRNWREVGVDEVAADLLRSDLIVSPPDDLESMIDSYNTTLRALVDKHVPLRTKQSQERCSARWFDRESKRLTRKLERRYRRVRTADPQAAWRQQFDTQRHLFQSKFTAFWLSAVESCQQNPRVYWRTVNTMLHPPRQHDTCKLSAADFASFFRSKVANIRTATASVKPPVIDPRQAPPLSQFQPATVEEITRLINTMLAESCSLDPIPTWLLKRLTPHIAPVICKLCNLSQNVASC